MHKFEYFDIPTYLNLIFYFTIQGFFFPYFFRNISKTTETILIKKIGRNHGISVYKKALISEHRKNYIFRDNNYYVKMSVC